MTSNLSMSDSDTVTLSRTEYEALLDRLEEAEDTARLREIEATERTQGKERRGPIICRPTWSIASSPASTRYGYGDGTAA